MLRRIGKLLKLSKNSIALTVLVLLRFVERFLLRGHPSSLFHIRIGTTSLAGDLISQLYTTCMQKNVTIEKIGIHSVQEHEVITLACHIRNAAELTQTIGELRAVPGVTTVEADIHGVNRKNTLNGDAKP